MMSESVEGSASRQKPRGRVKSVKWSGRLWPILLLQVISEVGNHVDCSRRCCAKIEAVSARQDLRKAFCIPGLYVTGACAHTDSVQASAGRWKELETQSWAKQQQRYACGADDPAAWQLTVIQVCAARTLRLLVNAIINSQTINLFRRTKCAAA